MSRATRWTLAIMAVVIVLIAALVVEMRRGSPAGPPPQAGPPPTGRDHRDADTAEALAGPRRRADLAPCPAGADTPGPVALRGIIVECAADGSAVDVARMTAGRRVVLNLWSYSCPPCMTELPAMAEYQRRAGPSVLVVTVHQDENETAALLRLADLDVHLPTLQDGRRRVAAALQLPNVMPTTVVLAADGTVAHVLPRVFDSAEEITAAVGGRP